ncbi:MAG: hypothetical protein HEEMFOPI_01219 [Holosporales bacterium]
MIKRNLFIFFASFVLCLNYAYIFYNDIGWVAHQQKNISNQIIDEVDLIFEYSVLITETFSTQISLLNDATEKNIEHILGETHRDDGILKIIDVSWVNNVDNVVFSRFKGVSAPIDVHDREYLIECKKLNGKTLIWPQILYSRFLKQDIIAIAKACYGHNFNYLGSVVSVLPIIALQEHFQKKINRPNYVNYVLLDKYLNIVFSSFSDVDDVKNIGKNFKSKVMFYDVNNTFKKSVTHKDTSFQYYKKSFKSDFYVVVGINWKLYICDIFKKYIFSFLLCFLVIFFLFLFYKNVKVYHEKNFLNCIKQKDKLLSLIMDTEAENEKLFNFSEMIKDVIDYFYHDIKKQKITIELAENDIFIQAPESILYHFFIIFVGALLDTSHKGGFIKVYFTFYTDKQDKTKITTSFVSNGVFLNKKSFYQHLDDIAHKQHFFCDSFEEALNSFGITLKTKQTNNDEHLTEIIYEHKKEKSNVISYDFKKQ